MARQRRRAVKAWSYGVDNVHSIEANFEVERFSDFMSSKAKVEITFTGINQKELERREKIICQAPAMQAVLINLLANPENVLAQADKKAIEKVLKACEVKNWKKPKK